MNGLMKVLVLNLAATHLEGDNCHLVNWIQSLDIVRRSQNGDCKPTKVIKQRV